MSESSEPESPVSGSGSAKKSDSKSFQQNNELEKRLALELSRFTAKKSTPNISKHAFIHQLFEHFNPFSNEGYTLDVLSYSIASGIPVTLTRVNC